MVILLRERGVNGCGEGEGAYAAVLLGVVSMVALMPQAKISS